MWFTFGAVLAAIPVGYVLGVLAAVLIAGGKFGQLPLVTVPLGIIASVGFALLPLLPARTRFVIMIGAAFVFAVVFLLVRMII